MPTPSVLTTSSDDLVALPSGLPASWVVRRPGPDDVDRLLQLCRECDEAVGTHDLTREEVEADVLASAADPRRNQLVVVDGERALAWTWVEDHSQGRTMLDAYVARDLPADQEELLGAWAWDWTVARGREVGRDRGVEETLLDLGTVEGDERAARWLRERDFAPVRTFYRMTRAVPAADEVPAPPPDVHLRPLRPEGAGLEDDLRTAYDLNEEAFADHWNHHARSYDEWWASHAEGSGLDLALWRLAEVDGRPVGLIVVTRQAESDGQAYVKTLATRREARGRGVATAMLWAAFAHAAAEGHREVALGVDGESQTGALRLYESVGMHRDLAITVWQRTVSTALPDAVDQLH